MKAKQIVQETPGAILANQYYNPVNPEAHYAPPGPEIWEQTGGRVTHFVAGAGTGGTVSGAAKFLKEKNPKIRVVAGDPVGLALHQLHRTGDLGEGHPYKVEGIGGDKIPTTHLVRLHRRVPPGERPDRAHDGPAAGAGGRDAGRGLVRRRTSLWRSRWRARSTIRPR